jgi:tRNA/rRNA methyltransferase
VVILKKMISVVFVGAETAGNVGSIARVMKNFGVKELVLVEPQCDHLSKEAMDRASHAKDVLEKAMVCDFSALKRFDYLVGTTAKLGSDYNIPRIPMTPAELAFKLKEVSSKAKIALVFGRESSGLLNEEIMKCDFTVTIPASKAYPTLNVSHSVAVVLYEIFKEELGADMKEKYAPMSGREKEVALEKIDNILNRLHFATPEKRETQKRLWKRMIGKSMLTRREAFALIGFLRKLEP